MEGVVVILAGNEADENAKWEGKFVWGRRQVLELIKEYKNMENEFKDHTIKRKVIWRKIAKNMKKNGMGVSWELCDKKWRNLKQTFKAIHTSKRSDISMRRWEFYSELEDIFKNDPSIKTPRSTIRETADDSLDLVAYDMDTFLCTDKEINADEIQGNTKEDSTVECESRLNIPECDETPLWFQQFLISYNEDEKKRTAMVETMLKDVVRIEEKKCELLEQICGMVDENSF